MTGRDFGRIAEAFSQAGLGLWHSLLSLAGAGAPDWSRLSLFAYDMVWPYFIGGLLPGIAASIASYYVIRPLIIAYQARRRVRMRASARRRLAAEHARADHSTTDAGRAPEL